MKKIFSLEDWKITKPIPSEMRMAFVTISLEYPNWKMVIDLGISERKKFWNEFLKNNFLKLINKKYFETYELVGTKRQPTGVKAWFTLSSILELSKESFVANIFIYQMEGAKKKPERPKNSFFCVKMTVSIQIEGFTSGMQSCEDRYVLVKAKSVESAYKLVAQQEESYGEPYLNSDARLVRWKIESYDDCFSTDVVDIKNFNKSEGVEVFSKFRTRKLTSDRAWDGKIEGDFEV